MRSQVALRREQINNDGTLALDLKDDESWKNTIFDTIVRANADGGKFAFDEEEVLGNTFIMLFAGHGTQ